MGGGVSSLPAEVSLAEAKELAGAKWQPAWEEKFEAADAKISKDEALKCWKDAEAKAAISEALYEKLRGGEGLIADQLASTSGKIDFASVGALPVAERRRFWLLAGNGTSTQLLEGPRRHGAAAAGERRGR